MRQATVELRSEERVVSHGKVHLFLDGSKRPGTVGELIDISEWGFRATFDRPDITSGTEIRFRHKFLAGRARVVWTCLIAGRIESGFLVLRT